MDESRQADQQRLVEQALKTSAVAQAMAAYARAAPYAGVGFSQPVKKVHVAAGGNTQL